MIVENDIPNYQFIFFNTAYGIDLLGNIICSPLFNVTLIKHGGYEFGKTGETISSVLGKGERDNTLTSCGKIIANFLNWVQTDHCKNSIQN